MIVSKSYVSISPSSYCELKYFLNAVRQEKGSFTFAKQLFPFSGDANLQISSLAEELARKTEDASRQQEEITHLLSQIVDLQKKAKLVWNPWWWFLCILTVLRICSISVFHTLLLSVFSVLCTVCCGERGADSAFGSSQRCPATTHCWGKTIHNPLTVASL